MSIIVSKNSRNKLLIRAVSISSMIVAATALSGCALVGGNSNVAGVGIDYSIATAATNTVAGDQNQNMPNLLPSSTNGDILVATAPAKYLPPANIGSLIKAQNNNSVNATSPNYNIVSNNLPALPKPINSGNTNTMPTQTMQTTQTSNVAPAVINAAVATQQAAKVQLAANAYYHKIESGESLFSIARKYNVTVASIVQANDLSSADKIGVGQKVAIPGRTDLLVAKKPTIQASPVAVATPVKKPVVASIVKPAPKKLVVPVTANINSDKFLWPASGKIITDFAASKGTGINISMPEGTPIKAAQSGTVIYVGNAIEGYGNLILIKHDNGYVSAYAHLSKATIARGDIVSRGQSIGLAGQTGSVTSSQLHFELRKGATPVDPVPMLVS